MQISQITQNFEKLAKNWKQQQEAYDEKFRQIERKGMVDPLTEEKIKKLNDALDYQKNKISELETAFNRPEISTKNSDENYYQDKTSLESYLKKGIDGNYFSEKKSLSSDGSFLLDNTTSKNIIKTIESNSIMRQLASVEKISTHALEIIKDNDNQDAGWVESKTAKWVGETDDRPETQISKLDRQVINAHEIYAQPKITQKLIDDAKIDIVKWIIEKISSSFAKVESYAFINGRGNTEPQGILRANNNSNKQSFTLPQKDFLADDIIKLYYSLPAQYAARGSFLMHRNMLQIIRSFKCPTTGHYIWSPGLTLGSPDTLLGAPVYESPDMPLPADNATVIAFADFKEAYKIVDRANINIIRDPFTHKPFIKFYATKRIGGDIVNSNAISFISFGDEN